MYNANVSNHASRGTSESRWMGDCKTDLSGKATLERNWMATCYPNQANEVTSGRDTHLSSKYK